MLQNSKPAKPEELIACLENKQSFYSTADFLVHFKALSEQKVSLQQEKSNILSC